MNFRDRLSKLKRDAASVGSSSLLLSASTAWTYQDEISNGGRPKRTRVETDQQEHQSSATNASSHNNTLNSSCNLPRELKRVERIYLVCPPNVQTGGPEAMHQLCDKINAWSGNIAVQKDNKILRPDGNNGNALNGMFGIVQVSAYMLYIQCLTEGTCRHCKHAKPIDAYSIYPHVKVCHDWNEALSNDKSSLVIWPECWTEYMTRDIGVKGAVGGKDNNNHHHPHRRPENQHQQAIWWLSVDNNRGKFQDWHHPRDDILHLYQSEYARQYIVKNLNKNSHNENCAKTTQSLVLPMTEYIPFRHGQQKSVNNSLPQPRDLEILYNPLKGLHYTDEIRRRSEKKFHFTPISGKDNSRLSPTEVIKLLGRGKVYIDFGNHPGMDRLPREAAMAGCIVITNKEGAAYYDEDVSIPSQYKIETFDVERIHSLLKECIEKYEERVHDFDAYREWIEQQESKMENCVQQLLTRVVLERE